MGNSSSTKTLSCCFCSKKRSEYLDSPNLEYFSPRIEAMMQGGSQFASETEHEIEFSKSHWSEVTGSTAPLAEEDREEENRQNRKLLEELMNDPQWTHPGTGPFFRDWRFVKLGEKIAEGGQAEIFEFSVSTDGTMVRNELAKVFKKGPLRQLQQQWPAGVLRKDVFQGCVAFGTLLEDGRFAFVMLRGWGDLRKLIDQAMIEKKNRCPPFPYVCDHWHGKTVDALGIMRDIAYSMYRLHEHGILHRDLKASNIILFEDGEIDVADFECSIGVVGTAFWRAPEILLALKNRNPNFIFTAKADVYSYGMTCFEIVTGRLPFEGELEPCRKSYDVVIEGQRPKLPSSLDVRLKSVIAECWHSNPVNRPSFDEICRFLYSFNLNV